MGKKPTNQDMGLPGVFLPGRKTASLIVLGLLFAVMTLSCGKPETPSNENRHKNENILRYDVNNSFTTLNPVTVESSGSNSIFPLLYSYLFVPNDMGNLDPDLAEGWSFDTVKKQWTIYLRNDALFHNNKPVTSKDVKYSYENLLKNIRPYLYSVIDRISLLSDTALCIHLKREDPLLLQKIWDFEIFPCPNGEKIDYFHHPIGSGPFKFKYRETNKMVVLEANDDFYNGRPILDKIVFNYQPDREKAWTRLLAGKTDIAQEITPKNYKMLKNYQDRFYFDQYTLRFYSILLYNTYDSLFSNLKVRRAMSLAIDRWYIVEDILDGYGRVANGPMGVDSPFHNPKVKPVPFDPKKALTLLKEAGWSHDAKGHLLYKDGKPFEFTLLVFKESQIEKKVARYLRLCLNELGIRARIEVLPFGELHRRYYRNTEFQAVLTEFGGSYRNPEDLSLWSTLFQAKSVVGCFEHPEVNHLIKKGLYEKDPKKQKKLFYKTDELITSLQPGTFLFQKTAIDVMSKRFSLSHPFSLTYAGIHRLRHASLRRD